MNRKTFYNDARNERKIDFLANWRTVRWYFCRKYDLPKDDLEYLLKLDSMGIFSIPEAVNEDKILHWDKTRWDRLRKETGYQSLQKEIKIINTKSSGPLVSVEGS